MANGDGGRHRSGLAGSFAANSSDRATLVADGAGWGVAGAGRLPDVAGDEFELQGETTTNPERQQGAEGGQKREHADDVMATAQGTLHLLGILDF